MMLRDRARSQFRRRAIVFLATLTLVSGSSWADPKARVVLFTAEEATQLRLDDAEWKPLPRVRSASNGPRIEVRSPALKVAGDGPILETATPANLVVAFQANESPVDMNSLEVTARKGFFSKSLTQMLKPYIHGTVLEVKDVAIPAGKFLIEIAIADKAGAKTVDTYRLQVDE
jgi:hypothetical protein